MSETDANRLSRRGHAAMAQFYRWFQLYERLHMRPWAVDLVERQLQIFADRFGIVAGDGRVTTTRDGYREGIGAYSPGERHAHLLDRIEITELDTHRLKLEAQATYRRLDRSGAVSGAHVASEGELIGSVDFEPLFTRLHLTVSDPTQGGEFRDAYPANRTLSTIHRFLYLVEARISAKL